MFKNQILPPVVIQNLYCPECSPGVSRDAECMIVDNRWILEYDMNLARNTLRHANMDADCLSPTFLFDQGYASWNGLTPVELDQRLVERQEIVALATQNMHRYLSEIKRWGCARVSKLREAGWRKAQQC
jgi:hypothetical protein